MAGTLIVSLENLQGKMKVIRVNYLICDISKYKKKKTIKKNNFINLGGNVDHRNKVKTFQSIITL